MGICFPDSSVGKESACNAGDPGLIPGLGRSSGGRMGYPLQYSGLENSLNYSPWDCKELDTTEQLSLTWASASVPSRVAEASKLRSWIQSTIIFKLRLP